MAQEETRARGEKIEKLRRSNLTTVKLICNAAKQKTLHNFNFSTIVCVLRAFFVIAPLYLFQIGDSWHKLDVRLVCKFGGSFRERVDGLKSC